MLLSTCTKCKHDEHPVIMLNKTFILTGKGSINSNVLNYCKSRCVTVNLGGWYPVFASTIDEGFPKPATLHVNFFFVVWDHSLI